MFPKKIFWVDCQNQIKLKRIYGVSGKIIHAVTIKWSQHQKNQDIRQKTNQPQLSRWYVNVVSSSLDMFKEWKVHVSHSNCIDGFQPMAEENQADHGQHGRPNGRMQDETWHRTTWVVFGGNREAVDYGRISYSRQQVQIAWRCLVRLCRLAS